MPRTTVATSLPSLGRRAPVLAMQTFLERPNIIGPSMAMCVRLSYHSDNVQRGVTITVIPLSSILVSVFDTSGGGGNTYE